MSPYRSRAQEQYFNVNRAKLERQGVDVNEWNKASKGLKLPKRIGKKKKKLKRSSPKEFLGYQKKVNNKSRDFGSSDDQKRVVSINKKRSKKFSAPGRPELLNTIVHELHHVKHPKATEAQTYKFAKQKVKRMSTKEKRRAYAEFK